MKSSESAPVEQVREGYTNILMGKAEGMRSFGIPALDW